MEQLARLSDRELAPRLEALFYLGWAETYLELYDDSLAHAEQGIDVARATGSGHLLVPLMLVRGFPLQMQGRLAEALDVAETAVEVARLSGNPHYLYWALFEQGWAHYYLGDLDRAIASADESLSVDSRLLGGTLPSAGGGPGWVRACARMELGRAEVALEAMRAIASTDLQVAAQRCFDGGDDAGGAGARAISTARPPTPRTPRPTRSWSARSCRRRWRPAPALRCSSRRVRRAPPPKRPSAP